MPNPPSIKTAKSSQGHRWTRSGCAKCKLRRKKCDEIKPRCGPCTKLGLDCRYDSIWRTPHTQELKPLRRRRHSGQPSSAEPDHTVDDILSYIQRPDESSANITDYNDGSVNTLAGFESKPYSQTARGNNTNSPMLQRSMIGTPYLKGDYSYYLSYYVTHLSRKLVMVDATHNPLRDMIIPRLTSSPMLLQAVCAVSACHLSQRPGFISATNNSLAAIRYYLQALKGFTTTLSRQRSLPDGVDQGSADAIVLTAVFLCKYEIVGGSVREWRHHLKGVMQLMDTIDLSTVLSPCAKEFLESFIIYHSEVAQITSGSRPSHHDPLSISNPYPNNKDWFVEALDPYMGYTKGVIAFFGRISRLPSILTYDEAVQESESIMDDLERWRVSDVCYMVPEGVLAPELRNLQLTAQAFHSAAIIYFCSILSSIKSRFDSDIPNFFDYCYPAIWYNVPSRKLAAVTACLAALEQISEGSPCESALLLPLFLVGCETEFPEQQEYALERLRKLERTVGIGNIHRARIVVEQVRANDSSSTPLSPGGLKWSLATTSLGWDLIIT